MPTVELAENVYTAADFEVALETCQFDRGTIEVSPVGMPPFVRRNWTR